jgi:hypothetical protein
MKSTVTLNHPQLSGTVAFLYANPAIVFSISPSKPKVLLPNHFYVYPWKTEKNWAYTCLHNGTVTEGVYDENAAFYKTIENLSKENEVSSDELRHLLISAPQLDLEEYSVKRMQNLIRAKIRFSIHENLEHGPLVGTKPVLIKKKEILDDLKDYPWILANLSMLNMQNRTVFNHLRHGTSAANIEKILKNQLHHSKKNATEWGYRVQGKGNEKDISFGDDNIISFSPMQSSVEIANDKFEAWIEYDLTSPSLSQKTMILKLIDWNIPENRFEQFKNLNLCEGISIKKLDGEKIIFQINQNEVEIPLKECAWYGRAEILPLIMTTFILKVIDKIKNPTEKDAAFNLIKQEMEKDPEILIKIAHKIFQYSEVGIFGTLKLTPDNLKSITLKEETINFSDPNSLKNIATSSFIKFPLILQACILLGGNSNNELFSIYDQVNALFNNNVMDALNEANLILKNEYTEISNNGEGTLVNADQSIKVYRPNHGIVHTTRTMLLADAAIEYLGKYAADESLQKFCAGITPKLSDEIKMMMAFLVTGRESEAGHGEDTIEKTSGKPCKNAAFKYRLNSADFFANSKSIQSRIDSKSIEEYKIIITYMCDPNFEKLHLPKIIENMGLSEIEAKKTRERLLALYHIVTIAHQLDLPRCKTEEHVSSRLSSLKDLSVKNSNTCNLHLERLKDYSIDLIKMSGEKHIFLKENSLANTELFCHLSNDTTLCTEFLKKGVVEYKHRIERIPMEVANSTMSLDGLELTYQDKILEVKSITDTYTVKFDADKCGAFILLKSKHLAYNTGDHSQLSFISSQPLSQNILDCLSTKVEKNWTAVFNALKNPDDKKQYIQFLLDNNIIQKIYEKDEKALSDNPKTSNIIAPAFTRGVLIDALKCLGEKSSMIKMLNQLGSTRIKLKLFNSPFAMNDLEKQTNNLPSHIKEDINSAINETMPEITHAMNQQKKPTL